MRESLRQSGLGKSDLAAQHHHWWNSNVQQSFPGFFGRQIRPTAHLSRACAMAQFLCLNQVGLNANVLIPTPTHVSSLSFLHGTSLFLSQESSNHLWRDSHQPSRQISRFKPLPPFHQRNSNSLQLFRFEMESRTAVPVWYYSAKTTLSTSLVLPRTPIVFPSRRRRPTPRNPSNGYPPFHHGPHILSSAIANHCFIPSAILTQLTRLSSNCRLQWQYLPCRK